MEERYPVYAVGISNMAKWASKVIYTSQPPNTSPKKSPKPLKNNQEIYYQAFNSDLKIDANEHINQLTHQLQKLHLFKPENK